MPTNDSHHFPLSLLYSLPLCICLPFSVSLHCSASLEENLTVSCNANCSCIRELYNPVCGEDGVMYYSPCHAGCTNTNTTSGKQVQYQLVMSFSLNRWKLDLIC